VLSAGRTHSAFISDALLAGEAHSTAARSTDLKPERHSPDYRSHTTDLVSLIVNKILQLTLVITDPLEYLINPLQKSPENVYFFGVKPDRYSFWENSGAEVIRYNDGSVVAGVNCTLIQPDR
jgi:hypothetical protein